MIIWVGERGEVSISRGVFWGFFGFSGSSGFDFCWGFSFDDYFSLVKLDARDSPETRHCYLVIKQN